MTVQDFPTVQAAIDADKFHPGKMEDRSFSSREVATEER
jgi:hypothetical protein